ncbi:hypothetical protein KEM48_005619 [Puccinia striiformis f. sp. tritici PST-130]|nr:hypothetical protein KEM48_005619 [Puccinia striiformis f. sp. tritici PST-130]
MYPTQTNRDPLRANKSTNIRTADRMAEIDLSPHLFHPNHDREIESEFKPSTLEDGFIEVPAEGDLPGYALYDRPIITSASDTRTYRIIRLKNDLQVILIHDPKTDKAAAAMDVNVGHLSDPENLQGLAHFCEHLLFLGNSKYPSENEYSEYLSKNSGHSNAFTGMDNTVYYFDIHPSALTGGLDRFSQFFISPTFTESCTDREIKAVDSENSKNLQNDQWRLFQLDKSTSDPNHHFWRFGTGNLKTLVEKPKKLGLDIRQELLSFYHKHYSSNVMNLAVLGKEPIEDLTKLVLDKFSLVPNRNVKPDRFDGSPYSSKQLSKLIFTKMVKDTHHLEITFPMPDQAPFYDTQPLGLSVIISERRSWVNNELSQEDGLEWAFKEQALLSEIRFRFKSASPPSSYVTSLASWLRRPSPPNKVISSIYLSDQFNPKLIQEHLELLKPENSRILIGTQHALPGINYDCKEEWYGTEYTIQDLPASFLELVVYLSMLLLYLHLTHSSLPTFTVWHKKDDRWWLPRASVILMLRNPITNSKLKNLKVDKQRFEILKVEAERAWKFHSRITLFTRFILDGFNLLERGFVESLIHGNMTIEEAKQISNLPRESLVGRPAVDYYLGLGDMADDLIRTKLCYRAINPRSCFNRLRTNEQLGYLVRSYTLYPQFVESRIEHFLHWFLENKLRAIPDDEFEEMKTSLINKALEDFKNMSDETSHYWMHIKAGYYGFEQRFKDVEIIKKITKESMIEFYEQKIDPSSPNRSKCSTHVVSLHVPVPTEVLSLISSGSPSLKVEGTIVDNNASIEGSSLPVISEGSSAGNNSVEIKTELQILQPTPEDLVFLQSKPDKPSIIKYLQAKKLQSASIDPSMIDAIIKSIEDSLHLIDQQIIETRQSIKINPNPIVFNDIQALKDRLVVGSGATPVEDWKTGPSTDTIDLTPPPKL